MLQFELVFYLLTNVVNCAMCFYCFRVNWRSGRRLPAAASLGLLVVSAACALYLVLRLLGAIEPVVIRP